MQADEDLVSRILAACETILKRSGIFERVRQNTIRRCNACSEVLPANSNSSSEMKQITLKQYTQRKSINIYENKIKLKKQTTDLRSQSSQFSYLPSRCIDADADYDMKQTFSTTRSLSQLFPLDTTKPLIFCKHCSVAPHIRNSLRTHTF